jgi:dipeptidyl-peptidase 4
MLMSLLACSSALGQGRHLTLDDIYNPDSEVDFDGPPLRHRQWLSDGLHFLETTENGHFFRVDARSGESEPLYDVSQFETAFAALGGFSSGDAIDLLAHGRFTLCPGEAGMLIHWKHDLYYFDLAKHIARRLTADTQDEEVPTIAPSGQLISFVRGDDLFVVSANAGFRRRLTSDGSPDLLNGKLDWVYQEEVFGRGDFVGHWWSPDSRMIAFLQLDESSVPHTIIVNNQEDEQKVESQLYPKAGDPNPVVRLGVVAPVDGSLRWADLSAYAREEFLIVGVTWAPTSERILIQIQNRQQTWLDLVEVTVSDGTTRRLLHETTPAWVSVLGAPHWLEDGSFIWESERDGYRHLYHYSADGRLLGRLTSGEWDVSSVIGIDDPHEYVYFTTGMDHVIDLELYRVHVDGSGLEAVTSKPGTHSIKLNPQRTLFLDTWNDILTPPQVWLYDTDGKELREVQTNPGSPLADYELGPVEFFQVPARDGFEMEAMWIKPPNFDASHRYPVLVYVYGGPQTPTVRNRWTNKSYLWHQMLAEQGYLIFLCDNRSASGKGVRPAWSVYRNLGQIELRDLEDAVGWLKTQPFVAPDRIGLWGWSYGGFMTSYALTHSSLFKMGISGAPVTDWHLYDSIYTERYMGLPQSNPEGYRTSSVILAADNLSGRLLLLHGTTDDNVHTQNSIQLIDHLQKGDKDFDMMFYPGARHGVRNPRQVLHLRTLMTKFVKDNL